MEESSKKIYSSDEEFQQDAMTVTEAVDSCHGDAKTFVLVVASPSSDPDSETDFVQVRVQGDMNDVCGLIVEATKRLPDDAKIRMGLHLLAKGGKEAFARVMTERILSSEAEDEDGDEPDEDCNKALRDEILKEIEDEGRA